MTLRVPVLFFLLPFLAPADTLVLRNGTQVAGRWWATNATVVSFLVKDQLEYFQRSEVSEVVFGDAPVPPAAPQPDQIGAIYFQDAAGSLILLERIETPARGVAGARSLVRIKAGAEIRFVVRVPSGAAPPAFSLNTLESNGSRRSSKSGAQNSRALTVTKLTGDTYTLLPMDALPPGEYAFSTANANDAYCFGIDP
jgi:hypothetical protein